MELISWLASYLVCHSAVEEIPHFHGPWRFITLFSRIHTALSEAILIQSAQLSCVYLRSVLLLSVEWVTLLFRIPEVPDSNLDPGTTHLLDGFRGFTQSLWAFSRIVPSDRSQPIPSTPFRKSFTDHPTIRLYITYTDNIVSWNKARNLAVVWSFKNFHRKVSFLRNPEARRLRHVLSHAACQSSSQSSRNDARDVPSLRHET